MTLASKLGDRFRAEFVSKIVEIVSGALLTVALARILNPNEYGLLFLAISVLSISKILSTLGIPKSGGRYISEYKEKEPEKIKKIIYSTFVLTAFPISIVIIILLLGHRFISTLLNEPELATFLLIGTIYILFSTNLNVIKGLLWGFEAIRDKSVIHAVDRGLRLPFALGFAILGYGALGAFAGYIISAVVASVVGVPYIYNRYTSNKYTGTKEEGLRRQIFEYAVPLTASNAARVLDNRIDILLVGFFINPTAVAFYTVSKQVSSFVLSPIGSLGVTLGPTFQAQKAQGNIDTASRMYEEALSYGLLLYIPAVTGLIIVARPAIEFVFGAEYLSAVPVLRLLALWALLRSVTAVTGQALDFLGRAKHRAIVYGGSAGINFVLNLLLIPLMGVVGAAVATVITYSLYTVATLYIITIELNLRTSWLLRRSVSATFISLLMAIPVYFLVGYVSDIITLVLVVVVGGVTWLLLATGLGYLDLRRVIGNLT
jgi:O-antigen/teichoic acid export membrane protein